MDDRGPDLRTLLRAQLESESQAGDGHPGADELQAFQEGALAAGEAEQIRGHLSRCPSCADFVLALSDVQNLGAGATEQVPRHELDAAWSTLRQEIHWEGFRPRTQRGLLLLAATLAVAVVGLSLWCWRLYIGDSRRDAALFDLNTELRLERIRSADLSADSQEQGRRIVALQQELTEVLQPQINAPVVDLAPRIPRGPREPVPEIPPGSTHFTLVLEPEDRRAFPTYVVEMADPEGRSLGAIEGLIRTEFGNLTLTLARRTLPPGVIHLRLFGLQGTRRVASGEYAFSIRDP